MVVDALPMVAILRDIAGIDHLCVRRYLRILLPTFPRHSVSRSMRGYIESEFPSCDAERMYIFPNILRLDRVACPRLSPPSRRIESAVQSCPTDPRLEPSTLIGRQREESTGPYSATSLMIELTIQERPRSVPHCRLKVRISDLSGCKDLIRPFLEPQNP